jgi:hypothetical protein
MSSDAVNVLRLVVHQEAAIARAWEHGPVEEELATLRELPNGDEVEASVDLQAVPAVPVAALLDQSMGRFVSHVELYEGE